jgi:GMP synthase (glutamine-hydrolysing)
MPKTATVIRHIHFEDLGIFAQPLIDQGYAVAYHDVGLSDDDRLDLLSPDLLVVLGGPIGVYEVEAYPFMSGTIAQLRQRLAENRPTLGICLGAQLMAAALDAKVGPMGHKEIGFGELTLTEDGAKGPLRHIVGQPVLHWHGDAFQIPRALPIWPRQPCAARRHSRAGTIFWPSSSTPRSISPPGSSAG